MFFGAMSRSPLEDDVYNDPETRKDNALIQKWGEGGQGVLPPEKSQKYRVPMVYIFLSLFVLLECVLMLMTSTTETYF